MKEIILPSGAKLKVTLAPFADSKALYQAILEELKFVRLDDDAEVGVNILKDLFCAGFGSKKIEAALNKCMERCLYNGTKITDDTWEPVEAREDFMKVCIEVAKENILPFAKSLSPEFSTAMSLIKGDQESKRKTAQS